MSERKIYIDVKREQYLRVEISESEGFDIPEEINEFIKFYEQVKDDVADIAENQGWDSNYNLEIIDSVIVEE